MPSAITSTVSVKSSRELRSRDVLEQPGHHAAADQHGEGDQRPDFTPGAMASAIQPADAARPAPTTAGRARAPAP